MSTNEEVIMTVKLFLGGGGGGIIILNLYHSLFSAFSSNCSLFFIYETYPHSSV